MNLPLFYVKPDMLRLDGFEFDEDTSRHVIQVLRLKAGERVLATDGQGALVQATIIGAHKKHCTLSVEERKQMEQPASQICIAISPTKNAGRFEWFIEKATELGITHIIPLLCERTEKSHIKNERLLSVARSAMLQSRQFFLPDVSAAQHFPDVLSLAFDEKFIAHCMDDERHKMSARERTPGSAIILIGPEGDFTAKELKEAKARRFIPVSLGNTRLRTETAGMVAAVLLR